MQKGYGDFYKMIRNYSYAFWAKLSSYAVVDACTTLVEFTTKAIYDHKLGAGILALDDGKS